MRRPGAIQKNRAFCNAAPGRRLACLHARISNVRLDAIHKAKTMPAKNSRRIGIENLNIRGMVRNQCLARSIADAGFFEFRTICPQASLRQPRLRGTAFKSHIMHPNPTAGRAGASLPSLVHPNATLSGGVNFGGAFLPK